MMRTIIFCARTNIQSVGNKVQAGYGNIIANFGLGITLFYFYISCRTDKNAKLYIQTLFLWK